jgi:hypothetical protein
MDEFTCCATVGSHVHMHHVQTARWRRGPHPEKQGRNVWETHPIATMARFQYATVTIPMARFDGRLDLSCITFESSDRHRIPLPHIHTHTHSQRTKRHPPPTKDNSSPPPPYSNPVLPPSAPHASDPGTPARLPHTSPSPYTD